MGGTSRTSYFNPRSPQGERPAPRSILAIVTLISIHAPRRGSDKPTINNFESYVLISIHAPRRGSDVSDRADFFADCYFNPRSPQGERRQHRRGQRHQGQFQSTLPAGGATRDTGGLSWINCISIHAPRRGSDIICSPITFLGF